MLGRACILVFWTILLVELCACRDESRTLLLEASIRTQEDGEKVEPVRIPNAPGNIPEQSCGSPVPPLQSIIAQSPFLPILFARTASSLLADKQCGRDAQRFLDELANGTYWAARMFDASTKIPDGVLAGNKVHYGHFDECYFGGVEDFGTRYCLIDYVYNRPDTPIQRYIDIKASGCIWDFLKVRPSLWALDRSSLRLALCAPVSCTPRDVEVCLAKALEENFQSTIPHGDQSISVSVKPSLCQALNEKEGFTLAGLLFCVLLVLLCTLIVAGSWLHSSRAVRTSGETSQTFGKNGNCLARDFFECFSVQRNFRSLVERRRVGENSDIIDFVRTLFILKIPVIHRSIQYAIIPPVNPESIDLGSHHWIFIIIRNRTVLTDGLFTISAILMTKSWLEKLDSGKPLHFFNVIARRYIRMAPSTAFVILFYVGVLPHLGSGALWGHIMLSEVDVCRETWWHNVLYINNYTEDRFCMFQSWSSAVDIHAHILMFFVVKFFWRLPRRAGYHFLISLILLSGCVSAYVTHVNQFPPAFDPISDRYSSIPNSIEAFHDYEQFLQFYVKTHLRIAAFFVGAIAGAVMVDFRKTSKYFSKLQCISLALLGLSAVIAVHVAPSRYAAGVASDLEVAVIGGFHRILYSVAVAMLIVIFEFTADYKRLRIFLNPTWVHVLSKLAFGVYVCHNISQMYSHSSVRSARDMDFLNLFSMIVSDTCITLACSLLLWLAIESPIQQLLALISARRAARLQKTD